MSSLSPLVYGITIKTSSSWHSVSLSLVRFTAELEIKVFGYPLYPNTFLKVVVYPSYNDIHDIFLSEISSQRSRH